ncbi:hypothetical protein CHS0354_004105, partial [Potamilus streckersoni]
DGCRHIVRSFVLYGVVGTSCIDIESNLSPAFQTKSNGNQGLKVTPRTKDQRRINKQPAQQHNK